MIRAEYSNWEILETSLETPPDVFPRNIMPAREYPLPDSRQIDFDIGRPDIGQDDLKAALARRQHELQIFFPRQCGLQGKALLLLQMLAHRLKNLPGGSERWGWRHPGLQGVGNGVRVENGSTSKQFSVPSGERCLARAVGSSNERQSWAGHRELGAVRFCGFC